MSGEVKALPAPPVITERCPMCDGRGIVRLCATGLSRGCPTCRGSGVSIWDTMDMRDYNGRAAEALKAALAIISERI